MEVESCGQVFNAFGEKKERQTNYSP